MTTFLRHGPLTIRMTTEQLEVTSMLPTPDPDWRWTDSHGHEHRWTMQTFVWIRDEPDWMDVDGEEYPGEGHYACPLCGDHVTPGMRGPSVYREYMPGLTEIIVTFPDGTAMAITPEQFEQIRPLILAHDYDEVEWMLRRLA